MSSDSARFEIAGTGRGRLPHRRRVADARRQHRGVPARGGDGAGDAAFGRLPLSRRQLRVGAVRLAGRDRRSRQAAATLGPGLECASAERLRARRVHGSMSAARRRAVHHGERRLRRRVFRRAGGGVRQRRGDHADGTAPRRQRASGAVRHPLLGDRERDVGRLAVRLHVARPVDLEDRASSRAPCGWSDPTIRARRRRCHARCDDRFRDGEEARPTRSLPNHGPGGWSAQLLSRSIDDFEILSQHFYVYGGTHYDLEQGKQVPDDPNMPLVEWARKAPNMVRVEYEHYLTYRDSIPAMRRKHVTVAIDEWAYPGSPPGVIQAGARVCVGAGRDVPAQRRLHHGRLHLRRLDAERDSDGRGAEPGRARCSGCIAITSGRSRSPSAATRPTGAYRALWRRAPHVNAGSPTYPLDVAAALSADGKTLTVAVVNPTEAPQR